MRISLWILIAICVILQVHDAVAGVQKCGCKKNPNSIDWARVGIVEMFGWSFTAIANECEQFLGPNFYYAVQVSPITDHPKVTPLRPWWEVYQPVSYQIISRAGNEAQFRDMVERCNKVGVRVYVDVVLNHMTNQKYQSMSGAAYDVDKRTYSDATTNYQPCHFHNSCPLNNYQNAWEVRFCELYGMPDLKTEDNYVRQKLIDFLNKIIGYGVAGFRFDTAKHIVVADLEYIKSKLNNLNSQWFCADEKVFIYLEVPDLGTEPIKETEYLSIGSVEEFKFSDHLCKAILGKTCITTLKDLCIASMIKSWNLVESDKAVVCIDNHDTQRQSILSDIVTYQDRDKYLMAYSFMFAANYGKIRIMSSYKFSLANKDAGPPCDGQGNILAPTFDNNGQCNNGWICEHRWPEIRSLVHTKFIANLNKLKWEISDWWTASNNQVAFTVGYYAMFIYNTSSTDITIRVKTSIDCGVYCDVLSGGMVGGKCKGYQIEVTEGYASVTVKSTTKIVYLHISNRLAA